MWLRFSPRQSFDHQRLRADLLSATATFEELLDANALPAQATAALRHRYHPAELVCSGQVDVDGLRGRPVVA
jgi:hypothetical protein